MTEYTNHDLLVTLDIEGMSCSSCVASVTRVLEGVDGVRAAEVNFATRTANVRVAERSDVGEHLKRAVERAGFEVIATQIARSATPDEPSPEPVPTGAQAHAPTPPGPGAAGRPSASRPIGLSSAEARAAARETAERKELARDLRDLIAAAILAVPLLVLGMSHGAIPFADTEGGRALQLVLGLGVIAWPGRRFFVGAMHAARRRSADMNTLVALGIGAAALHSTLAVLVPTAFAHGEHARPHLYFEAAAAIVAFVLLGKLLETRARRRLSAAVKGLVSLLPKTTTLIRDGVDIDVPVHTIARGDLVRVFPGERVPADGEVVSGSASLDESMMTGESRPVDKEAGARVYGGTLASGGALVVRVSETGQESALGRIVTAVERAQGKKAPIARLADRVSRVFVPVVLGVALVTFAVWFFVPAPPGVDPLAVAIEHMIAVLVIACPCALGLATPAAVAVGMGRGAELGILYGGGEALETASHIDTALIDKTGTLTRGKPELEAIVTAGATSADDVLAAVASLERSSEHPVGRGIAAAAEARDMVPVAVERFVSHAGGGVEGVIAGRRWLVGNDKLMARFGVDTGLLKATAADLARRGATPVYAASGEGALTLDAVLSVADLARPEAQDVVAKLGALGVDVAMVTGDRAETARAVADTLGIERVEAEVLPTDKADLVAREKARGRVVAMVGDGVNDAPALATADLGVAVAHASDIAAHSADLTLARGIGSLPTALGLARKTMATIKRNLFWAFIYNVVGIPLAAGVLTPLTGWTLSPVFASLAMSLSSVSVLLSSLWLRRFRASAVS